MAAISRLKRPIKRPYIPLTIPPRGLGCEKICRKSSPGKCVLNLTCDSCFKVKWGHHTKISLYLPYFLVLGLQNVKTAHGKSWSVNVLPVNNFVIILKNKMGCKT